MPPFQEVQWVVLAYLLTITTLIVSAGRLGDIFGRRRLLLSGMLLFTLASILCGLATTLWLLILARATQGAGAAIMMALSVALIGEHVPKARLASAMGLLGTMSAVGTALGPSLGGLLIAATGWRAIFLINLPLGMLAILLVQRYVPVDIPMQPGRRPSFDIRGSLLLAVSLAAYALGMTMGRGSFGVLNLTLLTTAGLGAGLFLLAQSRTASPLIPVALMRGPLLLPNLVMSVIVSTVMMATLVVGPFYLTSALMLDTALVGLAMTIGPLVVAVTGVPAGVLADRVGATRMLVVGLIAMVVGVVLLTMLPLRLGVAGYMLPMVVLTLGYGVFQTANNTIVMKDADGSQRGAISGLLSLSRNLGLITGASLMGAVFAYASGTGDITVAQPEAVAVGMRSTFALAALLVIAALFLATRLLVANSSPTIAQDVA
jgi:MFS family permease